MVIGVIMTVSRGGNMKMSKFQKWMLRKIASKVVIQGEHHPRIIEFYRIFIDEARKQFNEDNKITLDSFLEECFKEALDESLQVV